MAYALRGSSLPFDFQLSCTHHLTYYLPTIEPSEVELFYSTPEENFRQQKIPTVWNQTENEPFLELLPIILLHPYGESILLAVNYNLPQRLARQQQIRAMYIWVLATSLLCVLGLGVRG